jgi:hypothetical protein
VRDLAPALLLLLAASGAARAATQVTSEPSPIILGRTPVVSLTLQLDPALAAAPGALRITTNAGELGNPVDLGGGRFRASYAPPPTKFPQMALLAVWKETSGPAAVEFVRLPLHGVTKVEASSRPGAELRARVGEEVYGPSVAGKDGQAVISVVIGPGTRDMVLLARTGGITTERTVAVDAPPYNRLAAAVTPSRLRPGASGPVRLEVLYDVAGEVDPAVVHARASAGTLAFEGIEGNRLRYRWDHPGAAPAEVSFSVTADGDPASSATAVLRQLAEAGYALRVGARVGLTHSLATVVGPRFGLDAWASFSLGELPVGVGLAAGYGSAEQFVSGPTAAPLTRSEVSLLPLALRVGFMPVRLGERAGLMAGAGFTATVTRYRTFDVQGGLPGVDAWRLAPSALLFAGGAWDLGPGQLFGEVVLSWAALNDQSFRVQAGGVGVEVGYRFDVLRGR